MIASVDPYLARQRAPGYDCLSFARDVWRDATGEDLRDRLDGLFIADRQILPHHLRAFERLDTPSDPCLVLMRSARAQPHMGVMVRGRVLHLHEGGVEYQPIAIASRSFDHVEFYR